MKLAILITPFFLIVCAAATAQSQGPNSPAAAVNSYNGCLACPGSDLSNPLDVLAADGNCAEAGLAWYPYCFQSACHYSRYLLISDFGFSVPPDAVITGVKAEILRKSNMAALVQDTIVRIYIA